MAARGDELVVRLEHGETDDLATDLLREFFAGYPLDNLSRLLRSKREHVVKNAAWIASELGDRAKPIQEDVFALLNHPSKYVRFFVLDSILVCAGGNEGSTIAKALRLLHDPDGAVRWKALVFLSRATIDQLAASISAQMNDDISNLTRWLIGLNPESRRQEILQLLESRSSIERLFAVAAAARFSSEDVIPLHSAAQSGDDDVRSFALEQIRSLH